MKETNAQDGPPGLVPPLLSIIVPTFNRKDRLKRLLTSLEREHSLTPVFEVVVVVDGSADGTIEMLAELRPAFSLRVIAQSNSGPAAARNRGIALAGGDVLLFLDDDVTAEAGLVGRHLAVHERDDHAVVIGPMRAPRRGRGMAPWLRWEALMLQKQYDAMLQGVYPPTPRQFYTANASLLRKHARAVGGFDESFTRAEDVEFAYRLGDTGLHFYFDPAAVVWHEPDRTFRSWLRVAYEYGRHDVLMARDCGREQVLETAYEEWGYRHRLNKLVAVAGVGHSLRIRLMVGILRPLVAIRGRRASAAQMALCSALFNLQYWQGVADETGLKARVWAGQGSRQPLPVARAAGR